jgi:hypothetical protein
LELSKLFTSNITMLEKLSFIDIRFSISRKAIIHLIQSSGTLHLSLKKANCREYLEPQTEFSGSMKNSKLIQSTLSIFFTLKTKEMGGSCAQKESKKQRIWKTYSWPSSGLKFFSRSVITVLYIERTIAIYDCHLF